MERSDMADGGSGTSRTRSSASGRYVTSKAAKSPAQTAKAVKSAKAGSASAKSVPAARALPAQMTRSAAAPQDLVEPVPTVRAPEATTVTKVSVSMPESLAQLVREAAGPGRFSAYVTASLHRSLELDRLASLVTDIEESLGGPICDDLMAEAEAAWHGE